MELNIRAAMSDQQKSCELLALKTIQEGEIQPPVFYSAWQPLKEIKDSRVKKLMQTNPFFPPNTLITSCYCLAKTILFNCLISPSHYSIQYSLYWQQAAYRAQLYRSVLVMVRHACAASRQRGKAAGHSVRLRCGIPSRSINDSREISFHDSLTCLQSHISEGTTWTKL